MDHLRISIITPSYQQAQYLEDAILSVRSQGYPNIEHIVMDGGSDDGSVEILEKHGDQLTYWESMRARLMRSIRDCKEPLAISSPG